MIANSFHESIKVQLNDSEPAWATTDFVVGLAIGSYESISTYAYGETCFVEMFKYSQNGIAASQTFNTGLPDDNWWVTTKDVGLGLIVNYGLGGLNVAQTCKAQYNN